MKNILHQNIKISDSYRWKKIQCSHATVWYKGCCENDLKHSGLFANIQDISEIRNINNKINKNFACVIETPQYVLALTDRIRSYPVFYYHTGEDFCVSDSARLLRSHFELEALDRISVLEFKASGYVTEKNTLYQKLYQLQPGEYILWDKNTKQVKTERYYQYFSSIKTNQDEKSLIQELGDVTDAIFKRIIDEAEGRPIWVPLSGGLDSKLVLCKLKEFNYPSLFSFSYGPPGNYEAKAAKHVAKTLNVPWQFVPSKYVGSRRFFKSQIRKQYWDYADGLCVIPFMQDLDVLLSLRKSGSLKDDAIVINGQSGDFITGGHIPDLLRQENPDISDLFHSIIEKHFSLWLDIKTKQNVKDIENKIYSVISSLNSQEKDIPGLFEYWEWQERQSKYVVNGQRIYDFMNLSWELPLWDDSYMDFWLKIPYKYKYNQALYKKYLEAYDFRGLFLGFSPPVWRWPGNLYWVVSIIGYLLRITYGVKYKMLFYKYASFFGHYRNHYAGYGASYFYSNIKHARGVVSFAVDKWFSENSISQDIDKLR